MDYEIKRACVYTRVSTDEQAKEGYSIEEQERRCRAQIESKGWEYVKTFSDAGISGMKDRSERPGLNDMIGAIERGEVDAIVIYKLDRLSRKQRYTMELIEDVIMKRRVALVSLNETLDTTTPWGRAMIGILSSFNQMECETITMRTSMGRAAKAKQGGYAGGKPPIGYRVADGNLVVVPEEAEIVRLVFKLRKDGATLMGIADELNRLGYVSKSGNAFRHSSVQTILANENIYRGIYHYGDSGEQVGQHEAILTDDEA